MSKRNRSTTTNVRLDMRKLLGDIAKPTFGAQIPDEYTKSLGRYITSETEEEKLEDSLIEFFKNFLNGAIPDEVVAKRYGMTKEKVVAIRDKWHAVLARYYF